MIEKPLHRKKLSELRIEETLCQKLDMDVYFSVKGELKNINKTYSLGMRKEDFKGTIESEMKKLKEWAIAIVKEHCPEKRICNIRSSDRFGTLTKRCIICESWIERFEIMEEDLL